MASFSNGNQTGIKVSVLLNNYFQFKNKFGEIIEAGYPNNQV